MNLGDKLYELRRKKNLTQDEVAEKLNVTRQTISKWETNLSTPDFDKIAPLCELYGITPNELLLENDNKTSNEGKEYQNTSNNTEQDNLEEAKDHLFTRGKDDEEDYENMTRNQIKRKSAEVVSSSVFMYILSVVFISVAIPVLKMNPIVASGIFLVIIGIATSRIIKHYMSIPKYEKTPEEIKQKSIIKMVNDIVGCIGVAIYFIVSFTTMAWHITWVIFIIIGLVENVIKLIFMLKEEEDNNEK